GRRADRIHHLAAQDLLERLAEDLEQRQAQPVHADVVVFPQRARRAHHARRALHGAADFALAEVTVVIDRVRLVPEGALPLARLLEEMAPRDVAVLRGVETTVAHGPADRLVERDEPAIDGEPGQERAIALGDAERQVLP